MKRKPWSDETRTMAQIREHYGIERELAARLRSASRLDRRSLYTELYNELYRRVPLHPQLTRKASPEEAMRAVAAQMRLLRPFLGPEVTFLEIGPGDCALSLEVARSVKQVYGVDVSDMITSRRDTPPNFRLVLSDGCSIPVPQGTVTVAYSNQVMEHLHPDDALEQLANIYSALAPGGIYICITPNRLNGPHDVSRLFDDVATGFHMKEYTTGELQRLLRGAGFSSARQSVGLKGHDFDLPVPLVAAIESVLSGLPVGARNSLSGMPLLRKILGVRLIAAK